MFPVQKVLITAIYKRLIQQKENVCKQHGEFQQNGY